MDFIERITGLIIYPDRTIRCIVKEPRILEAFVIVFAYALLIGLYLYVKWAHFNFQVLSEMNVNVSAVQSTLVSGMAMIGFLGVLMGWPITAGVLHLFSRALGGRGTLFPRMVVAIGYTEIVKVPAVLLAMILVSFAPAITLSASHGGAGALPGQLDVNFDGNPFMLAADIVLLLGLLWSSCLGVLSVKNGEGLSLSQSLIVVGVPLLFFIIYTYGFTLAGIVNRV